MWDKIEDNMVIVWVKPGGIMWDKKVIAWAKEGGTLRDKFADMKVIV